MNFLCRFGEKARNKFSRRVTLSKFLMCKINNMWMLSKLRMGSLNITAIHVCDKNRFLILLNNFVSYDQNNLLKFNKNQVLRLDSLPTGQMLSNDI